MKVGKGRVGKMITSKEAEILIGKTVVFPGRAHVSSDEIPRECRKYLCMRNTTETEELIDRAMMSCEALNSLLHEPKTLPHDEAVHMVMLLAERIKQMPVLETY